MKEEWKWIKGYDGLYQVSNLGRIKSFHRNKAGRIISTKNNTGWYVSFRARDKNRNVTTIRVHVAVAKAFIGDVPKGFHVHHKDENKQNNAVDNLEIMPQDKHQKLTVAKHPEIYLAMNIKNTYGNKHILQYTTDGFFIAEYVNANIAGKFTGVCSRNILQVANKEPFNNNGGIRKQAGGYVWKFAEKSEVMKCSG